MLRSINPTNALRLERVILATIDLLWSEDTNACAYLGAVHTSQVSALRNGRVSLPAWRCFVLAYYLRRSLEEYGHVLPRQAFDFLKYALSRIDTMPHKLDDRDKAAEYVREHSWKP